jgi:hypothetical protein
MKKIFICTLVVFCLTNLLLIGATAFRMTYTFRVAEGRSMAYRVYYDPEYDRAVAQMLRGITDEATWIDGANVWAELWPTLRQFTAAIHPTAVTDRAGVALFAVNDRQRVQVAESYGFHDVMEPLFPTISIYKEGLSRLAIPGSILRSRVKRLIGGEVMPWEDNDSGSGTVAIEVRLATVGTPSASSALSRQLRGSGRKTVPFAVPVTIPRAVPSVPSGPGGQAR